MRVKIGYTIDKNDISPLLNQMSCQSLTRVTELCTIYERLSSSKDYGVSSLEEIRTLSEKLKALLETAVDMESILTGLIANFGPKVEEQSEKVEDMAEKLKNIKKESEQK